MRTRNTKARGDSHLDALTPAQQEQLSLFLTTGNPTYEEAVAHVRAEFGVSTNVSSVRSYYFNVALPWSYAQARGAAKEIAAMEEGQFEPAIMKRLQQLAFELMTSPKVDVKTLRAFMKMLGDSRKLQLQQQTLSLELEKFRESVKTGVEKGLDALFAEIKGNAEALALFAKFKAAALQGVQDTKA
ncbi:MAG: hypothetical protein JNK23_10575 [Opitutaceae bacterium]|nr:hypothetical protein [Opitutaceae bacterium]